MAEDARMTNFPSQDDATVEQESRREARRGWLVLLLVIGGACAFFGLAIWRVLLPALRAAWGSVTGG